MLSLEATQKNRPLVVTTPLDDDELLFYQMQVNEPLGSLFQFNLKMLSKNPQIKLADLLGQKITIKYQTEADNIRYFNGYVSQFSQSDAHDDLFMYRATVHPWLWFLTQTTDCRIFQNKTVPDIIKAVFSDHDVSDFEEALTASYRKWENCVQYRETDFNFISRLLEQEGIYYYFKHAADKHTLVLADAIGAHEPVPGYEAVPYYPRGNDSRRARDHFYHWSFNQTLQPGVYALNDYDFKKPRANLKTQSAIINKHEQADLEIYDYPGKYVENSDGDHYAQARVEALQAQYEAVHGEGNVRGLYAGCTFKLTGFVREDQNRDYLVTQVNLSLGPQEYQSVSRRGDSPDIACGITAIDQNQVFRTTNYLTKPVVQGPQTAVVVGPAGEEIWTDQYGRVKVQFHWDRYGKVNENSSCWMRVSQVHAGKGFGGIDIPRIGEEVIISFIEGDPDRPIVTGRVYNGENKPPTSLPAAGMVSGLKSNSTPGGGGYNEMTMDDTKGKESIVIHAQKDATTTVENDRTTTVVGGSDTLAVQAGTRSVTVQGNTSLTVNAGDRTVNVTGNYQLDTTSEISLQAPAKITLTCGGSSITLEPGKITISAGGGASVTLDANALTNSSAGSQVMLDSNALMASVAGDQVLLDGKATLSSPAEATVEAPKSTLSGGGSTTVADASGVALTGPKVSLNG